MAGGILITPETRTKMDALRVALEAGKIVGWGVGFVGDVCTDATRNYLSPGQLNSIEKMYEQVVIGKKKEDSNCIPKSDRLKACKQSSGWQIYVDQRAIGPSMTKIDAEKILIFFDQGGLESLEIILNKKEK